ncbi:MFS general substrate transporter, partial [Acephala macrosclerotiorum]
YTIFNRFERVFYAWVASVAAFASPVTTSIYYLALTILAKALNTSLQDINLSITTYTIFQALAPTFVGGISDRYGQRPAYFLCFVIYIAANTGLALQTSYVALLILRMVQSSGSSRTISLLNGVVSDVSTRSERGKYIDIAALGSNLGPAVG